MEYQWVDISAYSRHFNISVSTIRRHIRSEKLVARKINGKYEIRVLLSQLQKKFKGQISMEMENERLKGKIRQLEQENQDLKMLIDIYEKKQAPFVGREPAGSPSVG